MTEETIKLRKQLDESESARKKAETLAATAQDEAHRLKQVTKPAKEKTYRRLGLFTREDE